MQLPGGMTEAEWDRLEATVQLEMLLDQVGNLFEVAKAAAVLVCEITKPDANMPDLMVAIEGVLSNLRKVTA